VSRALPSPKSKDNLEELNPVPFSGMVRIERGAVYPGAVACWRPWIEHLERVTIAAKSSWNYSLD